MAESYPLSGQYSPDHRNPYRTNEAFHFDPDEEEKLAGHLEGIITRFLAQSFYLKLGRQYVCGLFWNEIDVKYLDVMKVVEAFEIYVYQQIIQHVLA